MPALSITDGTGRPFDLSSFRGRVVLLNLWATWCGPCVREMPALDRLQAELGGAGFAVVALSLDRKGREVVEPFFGRLGLDHLDMYFASARATVALGARGLPTTFLIDHRGRLVGSLMGPAEWIRRRPRRSSVTIWAWWRTASRPYSHCRPRRLVARTGGSQRWPAGF